MGSNYDTGTDRLTESHEEWGEKRNKMDRRKSRVERKQE